MEKILGVASKLLVEDRGDAEVKNRVATYQVSVTVFLKTLSASLNLIDSGDIQPP